jgi:hypothetical protein
MAWKPDEGARIAQIVPDGEFYLVRNAGHFVQEDAGAEVAARLIRFLGKRVKADLERRVVAIGSFPSGGDETAGQMRSASDSIDHTV